MSFCGGSNTGGRMMTDKSAEIARAVVIAKVANQRTVLQRGLRDHPEMTGSQEIE